MQAVRVISQLLRQTGIAVDADLTTVGNIALDAQGGNLVMTGTSTASAGDTISLHASNNVALANVVATSVSVVADSG